LPTKKIRESIRKGLRELRAKGYLAKWTLPTNSDIVTVWKSESKNYCTIKDPKGGFYDYFYLK
jgi:hypothetical protein